jgi:hypothetical protein
MAIPPYAARNWQMLGLGGTANQFPAEGNDHRSRMVVVRPNQFEIHRPGTGARLKPTRLTLDRISSSFWVLTGKTPVGYLRP